MGDVLKDPERQKRLNEVYGHLFAHHGINSQGAFADALRMQRTALSAAMNGKKSYLTNNLFMKICAAFPGVFNLDYLLKGEGSLLTLEESVNLSSAPKQSVSLSELSGAIDAFGAFNAALFAQKQTIDSLSRELESVRERLKEKDEYIANLKKQLARSDRENGYHTQPANFMASDPMLEPEK